MKASVSSPSKRQQGFSLVEILVGVAIGLIGIVIMFQMFATWEERKRTTSSGSDAQVSGSMALYQLERDIRLAGYGFGTSASTGCTVSAYDTARPTPAFSFPMIPILITNGASGASDTITTLYGNSPTMSGSILYTASTTTSKTTNTRAGLQRGHLIIAAQDSTTCGLIEVTGDNNADGLTIDHATGNYTNYRNVALASRFNPAAGLGIVLTSGTLYNLGESPQRNIWQIRNRKTIAFVNDLRYTDADGDGLNDTTEIADGITNIQAEYGLDTDNNTIIDTWTVTPPITWSTVRAIRVGILARSQQYEKLNVTTAAPSWAGGAFVMTNVDGTADSSPGDTNDWRHYRYRVYQSVIPLRNMVWGTSP